MGIMRCHSPLRQHPETARQQVTGLTLTEQAKHMNGKWHEVSSTLHGIQARHCRKGFCCKGATWTTTRWWWKVVIHPPSLSVPPSKAWQNQNCLWLQCNLHGPFIKQVPPTRSRLPGWRPLSIQKGIDRIHVWPGSYVPPVQGERWRSRLLKILLV